MCVVERVGDFGAECQDVGNRKRALSKTRFDASASDVLHDEEVVSILCVEIEDRCDAGVREARKNQRLSTKSLAPCRVLESSAQQELEGDFAIEIVVVSFPDLAHPAFADALDEPVAAEH